MSKKKTGKVQAITKRKPHKTTKTEKQVTKNVFNDEEQFQTFAKAYTRSERMKIASALMLGVIAGTLVLSFFAGVMYLTLSLNQLLLDSLL